jgi:hypothetical protein
MKNTKIYIILSLAVLGFGYSIYLSFFSASDEKNEMTIQDKIAETEKILELAPQVLDMTNDTVKSYLETKKEYQEYLKKSDAIIEDSLDCNCPNKTK